MAQELSAAARQFLGEKQFAVLATINADGTVQQTVMWYELRGDQIMMNTRYGRIKDHNLKRDTRISICVQNGYRYVTIAGTAQLNDEPEVAQADIRALAIRYEGEEAWASQGEAQFTKQRRISIYLPIERVIVYGFDD